MPLTRTMLAMIRIEVIYAMPAEQAIQELRMPEGCTAEEAVLKSGLMNRFFEISVGETQLACFGHLIGWRTQLHDGDRVEILRPLSADPKESRRRRAKVQTARKKAEDNPE